MKVTLSTQIVMTFRDFYFSLYNFPTLATAPSSMEDYLTSLQLSQLPSSVQEELKLPITMEELQTAISSSKPGKITRLPDGLTFQYYKLLLPQLGPYVINTFNALGGTSSLPPDSLLSHISIIPKQSKDPKGTLVI